MRNRLEEFLRNRYRIPNIPVVAIHFVAFGNTSDPKRQTSCYETRTYMRFLGGMNDWRTRTENIAAQFGDLSNHAEHGLDMTSYSAYLRNIYLTGVLSDRTGDSWFDSTTGEMQLFNRTTGNGISFRDGILRLGRIDPAKPGSGTDFDTLLQNISETQEVLRQINSDACVSPVEKSWAGYPQRVRTTPCRGAHAHQYRGLSLRRWQGPHRKRATTCRPTVER